MKRSHQFMVIAALLLFAVIIGSSSAHADSISLNDPSRDRMEMIGGPLATNPNDRTGHTGSGYIENSDGVRTQYPFSNAPKVREEKNNDLYISIDTEYEAKLVARKYGMEFKSFDKRIAVLATSKDIGTLIREGILTDREIPFQVGKMVYHCEKEDVSVSFIFVIDDSKGKEEKITVKASEPAKASDAEQSVESSKVVVTTKTSEVEGRGKA